MTDAVLGIFVGGESRRMGSPKGLLRTGGVSLVERWIALGAELGLEARLVGRRPEYAAWAELTLDDAPGGIGPLGGLRALLVHAGRRPALAFACDMPRVSIALARRLLGAPDAIAVAAARDGRWEPFCARWDAERALPAVEARIARGARSLTGLLDEVGATALELSAEERAELHDWDTPADVDDPAAARSLRHD